MKLYRQSNIYRFNINLVIGFLALNCIAAYSPAQTSVISDQELQVQMDSLNRFIDQCVVLKNKNALDTLYAGDFVFTHGTGLVDSKSSWLNTVMDNATHYISRTHDSMLVEMHGDIVIITGTLMVQARRKDKISNYGLRYVRVFAYRNNRWQMISHRTVKEWHLN